MFTYNYSLTVSYGDTDEMGYYVYNDNYGNYLAEARREALRQLGVTDQLLKEQGITMPVIRMHVNFLQPAYCDDRLTIKTIISALPGKQMLIKYEIYNEKDQLINKAETYTAFADTRTKEPVNAPNCLLEKLKPYFEGQATQVVPLFNQAQLSSASTHTLKFRKAG